MLHGSIAEEKMAEVRSDLKNARQHLKEALQDTDAAAQAEGKLALQDLEKLEKRIGKGEKNPAGDFKELWLRLHGLAERRMVADMFNQRGAP